MVREWYFVRKLHLNEQPASGAQFELQILDDDGRAIAVSYLMIDTTELHIDGRYIPESVLEAAKQCIEGQGEYVGPDGRFLLPF